MHTANVIPEEKLHPEEIKLANAIETKNEKEIKDLINTINEIPEGKKEIDPHDINEESSETDSLIPKMRRL